MNKTWYHMQTANMCSISDVFSTVYHITPDANSTKRYKKIS